MQNRQESRYCNSNSTASFDKAVSKLPVLLTEALTKLAITNSLAEESANKEAKRFADKRTKQYGTKQVEEIKDVGYTGSRDKNDGVARDDQADEERGFAENGKTGKQIAQHGVHALYGLE